MDGRRWVWMGILAVGLAAAGCRSQQTGDAAIAQAKQLAAQTGVAQQVVWTDIAGNTTRVVVQPPVRGQTQQVVTRTVGSTPGDPRVLAPVTNSPTAPVISPVPSTPKGGTGTP